VLAQHANGRMAGCGVALSTSSVWQYNQTAPLSAAVDRNAIKLLMAALAAGARDMSVAVVLGRCTAVSSNVV